MIPIKWNGTNWVITTASDPEWYNYSNGNFATVMLSDGYYKSELQRGITDKQLASNNVGVGLPDDPQILGSIFTWIPRFAYLDSEIRYLKGTSILEYSWTTESCFNLEKYGANYLDLGFDGIWIGKKEFTSLAEVESKNTEMQAEENLQGLISNEKVSTITNSEITAIEKLEAQYSTTNETRLLNEETCIENRQVIKIINTNKKIPIVGKHITTTESIIIKDKYSENGIKYVFDKNGNVLDRNTAEISSEETQYTFYIVDNIGNIRRYKMSYGDGRPDISKFNKNTTFYVTYDENGNEKSSIPIGEKAPANWYSYENQQWANIVVRDGGNESYFVWIPRYMYKLNDDGSETVDVKFVDLENIWTDPENPNKTVNLNDSEYKLPEAFTWEDPENESDKIQLKGFWISKYKLRSTTENIPDISGGGGVIRVKNVVQNADYTYEMYLIQNGKRIVYSESAGEYIEGTEPINLEGNYTFRNVPVGTYAVNIIVKDKEGNYIQSIANEVSVIERAKVNEPDISEFNKALTYYVAYDEEGNEDSSIPIGENPPSNWYDYDNQQWANVVVRENGLENYYVWIPKYEYSLNTTHEKTNIQFIEKDKVTADVGYTIPEAFTWEKTAEDGTDEKVPLSGFWIAKYKLRGDAIYNLSATVAGSGTSLKVGNVVSKVDGVTSYEISLISTEGKILKAETSANGECSFKGLEAGGTYAVNIVAKNASGKMIAGYSTQVTLVNIDVDLTGFNKSTTFYVTYDENGNEDSTRPIGENAPDNWYDYASSEWANIVVRENGSENYYVWIPRYQYVVNSSEETVKAEFIPVTKETPDPGSKIPESFTWEKTNEDGTTETVQLKGFWISKYKLRQENEYKPEISGGSGVIYIKNVVEKIGAQYSYEAYLINEQGQRIAKTGNTYAVGANPVSITGNYTFTNVPVGNYTVNIIVKDSSKNHIMGITKQVTVAEKAEANEPDLTGFNNNLTYYVTYNDLLGSEESSKPIGENPPEDWYDYDNQKWANIVVRENGLESYFVWIPRYEYALDTEHETTKVKFIPVSQAIADAGYAIPDAFTWEKTLEDGTIQKIPLSGFWMAKYKLRDDKTCRLDATITVGTNKIRVSNIISTSDELNFIAYLIKDGKVIDSKAILASGEVTFNIANNGKYSVLVKQWNATNGMVAGIAKEVEVQKLPQPDLTGFNVDMTYIVTYDDAGNENKQRVAGLLNSDAVINSDRTLKQGQINLSGINGVWYDYASQKWANIVTIDETTGNTNYYVWIPRYQYITNSSNEKTKIDLISVDKVIPDPGAKIPESFTWEKANSNGTTEKVELPGFWISKYKLRAGR